MKKIRKYLLLPLCASMLMFLYGCDSNDGEDAVEHLEDAGESVGEAAEDAAEGAADAVEEAGDKLKDAVD